jgi:hypothetical protein
VIRALNIGNRLRALIAIAVLASVLALPADALAHSNNCSNSQSDPTAAQYCPQSAVLGDSSSSSNTPVSAVTASGSNVKDVAAVSSGGGSLPFTGLDVGTLVLAAVVLTGTGLALRRLTASGAHRD